MANLGSWQQTLFATSGTDFRKFDYHTSSTPHIFSGSHTFTVAFLTVCSEIAVSSRPG